MADNNQTSGVGCLTAAFIILAILKVAGISPVAEWSWLWIFGPFWIPILLAVGILLFIFIIALIFLLVIVFIEKRIQ